MRLVISGNRKVSDIQNEFNKLFPFLALAFYHPPENYQHHFIGAGAEEQLSLKDIRRKEEDGVLFINGHMTIMQLENLLSDEFGLYAEVLVKSGKEWSRSSLNGYWMLQYKNEEGRRTSEESAFN